MEDDVARAGRFAAFLRRSAGQPFEWGRRDCALWCADWIAEIRGHDPLARYRGAYADEAGCRAIVQSEGGLPALISRAFAEAGLVRGPAGAGDVGLVGTLLGPALMICLGPGRWVGKAPRGIRILRDEAALTWSISCPLSSAPPS